MDGDEVRAITPGGKSEPHRAEQSSHLMSLTSLSSFGGEKSRDNFASRSGKWE